MMIDNDDLNVPYVPILPLEVRERGVATKGIPIAHDDAESVSTAAGWVKRKKRDYAHTSDPMHLARGRHTDGQRFSQPPTFYACRARREDFMIETHRPIGSDERMQVRATWSHEGKPYEMFLSGLAKDEYSLRMVLIERCFASMT